MWLYSVMGRRLSVVKDATALLHGQIARHVMYENLGDLVAASAERLVGDDVSVSYKRAVTHHSHRPRSPLLRLFP